MANRQKRLGGGIAIAHRNTINVRKVESGTTQCFEFSIWKLVLKNITLHVIGVYRPPSLSTASQFVIDFFNFMEKTLPNLSNLLVMGDFNLHIHDDNSAISDFRNSLYAMGLEQHVDFSTHTGGQSLDLVITETVNGVKVHSCKPGPYISDHCVVKTILNIKKESVISKTITFRNFKDIDQLQFSNDLKSISIENDVNINDYVDQFEYEIQRVLDHHAPLKEKN